MKERTRDSSGDGDQVALAREDFDLTGAGEFGQVYRASIANLGGGHFVSSDRWERWKQLSWVHEQRVEGRRSARSLHSAWLSLRESPAPVGMTDRGSQLLNFIQSVSVVERELGNAGAPQRLQMGSATQRLAHVMGNGSHVGAGTNSSPELDAVKVDGKNFKFFDLNLHRIQADLFLFAREFVGGDAFDFLRGERRRRLRDRASELPCQRIELFPAQFDICRRAGGFTLSIVGVGGEAEADRAFVGLFRAEIELRQTGETTYYQRKDPGSHGVKRSEMSDGSLAEDAAGSMDDIVRGQAR